MKRDTVCAASFALLLGLVVSVMVLATATPPPAQSARSVPALVRLADRLRLETAACRHELALPAQRTERRYAASASPAFRRWAVALWAGRRVECLHTSGALVQAWTPTMLCESNKNPAAGGILWSTLVSHNQWGTFYFALQFVRSTWDTHRGSFPPVEYFVARGIPPSPAMQATVASRLGYDGWPNCP